MPYYTDQAWWTVEDAARLLRVNRKTLYDACKEDDFPHQRLGWYIRIPAEALGMRVRPETKSRTYHVTDDHMQYELPLDPACLIPVKRFRNGDAREPWHYEDALYAPRVRMSQSEARS